MDAPANPWGDEPSPFDALEGEDRIRRIVDRFYDIIAEDAPTLRAMLPKDDSTSRNKLHAYLVEWTGGPAMYSVERGHPRMRMRHMPFKIGDPEVELWLGCMGRSLDENDVDGEVRTFLDGKIMALAHHMKNQ